MLQQPCNKAPGLLEKDYGALGVNQPKFLPPSPTPCPSLPVMFFQCKRAIFMHKNLPDCITIRNFAVPKRITIQEMKVKNSRMEALKMLISSQELCSQEEVLQALEKEGYKLTQATLSRDLKQLKVAKAASMNGKYVYVLPNETMYKRVTSPRSAREMLMTSGYLSINFSGNMAIVKTRPGYASSIAYNIDSSDIPQILGTIAGDDTLFIALREGTLRETFIEELSMVIPDIKNEEK